MKLNHLRKLNFTITFLKNREISLHSLYIIELIDFTRKQKRLLVVQSIVETIYSTATLNFSDKNIVKATFLQNKEIISRFFLK